MENHGLKADQLVFSRDFLKKLIQDYTRESGVRELDRKLAEVIRRMVRKIASDEAYKQEPQPSDLEELLGIPRFSSDAYQTDSTPGVAIGLAWTQVGGDILFIEASLSKGKGKLTLTGNLGDVMKESATTALSFVHANCDALGISQEVLENNDIHIHVPAGAIPKDGPSAGITMLSAITSAYTKRPLRQRLAMTGEITLRGKVLPVGGIKEKVLAARRAGVTDIILCADNEKDVKEIKSDYISGLNFHYVTNMLEVINKSL
jgi:ATP-dependent Lon protease